MDKSKTIIRDSYFWNLSASMLNAGQSVILLIVITHTMSLEIAGIFTISYAMANLLLILANYGMRAYQVTDITNKFTFGEYRTSRLLTVTCMYMVVFAYVIYMISYGNYSRSKGMSILFMCILKSIDAVEDVYHGMYQQQGRLDVGAKLLTIRLLFTMLIFSVAVILFRNLNIALLITIILSAIGCAVGLALTINKFSNIKKTISWKSLGQLLITCFPIFAGSFLSFYIGNAPKYAIDVLMDDAMQACYAFLSMPVFVVSVLNNCIYQPILTKLAVMWKEGKKSELVIVILKQCGIVATLTITIMFIGYLIGIPVLSFLYNTNLSPYKADFIILLAAGGFLALSGFLSTVIMIIRFQKSLIWAYFTVALLAYQYFPVCVAKKQLRGASWLFLGLMCLLGIIFSTILVYRIRYKNVK